MARFPLALAADLSDETLLGKDGCAMTMRKIGMFFVIVMAVFGASRGSNNVRRASASVEQRHLPTNQPARGSFDAKPKLGNFDAFDLTQER